MPYCPANNATFVCSQQFATALPTPFSIQYWLFSLIVMFSITALIISFAVTKGNVEIGSDVFIYLLFVGMLAGSFIDLLLNIIGYGFVLIITLTFGIYIWRTRT